MADISDDFSEIFSSSIISSLLSSGLAGFVTYLFTSEAESPFFWVTLAIGVVFLIVFYYQLGEEYTKSVLKKSSILNSEIQKFKLEASNNKILADTSENKAEVWKQTLLEKSSGFPTLFSHIEFYDKMMDDYVYDRLLDKQRPAPKAAEEVKEQSRRRREAEKEYRITKEIIEFYENLEPSLIDYKNEEFGNIEEILQEWTEEEQADPVTYFVGKEEYRSKSPVERNQLALDRYWKRPHSKWHIGIMYERYIGYLYEMQGYQVSYQGVKEGKKDLGRDLIAQKGNEYIVIQCKYWNQFRSVFENSIFQFFGTVFQYKHANKSRKVVGIFYTTTTVSDLAKIFAKELGIKLQDNYKMDRQYPCIKCNITGSGKNITKIYHLPFDQQYDNVLIEPKKGEFYCATTAEAESKGFRRAWRWSGAK